MVLGQYILNIATNKLYTLHLERLHSNQQDISPDKNGLVCSAVSQGDKCHMTVDWSRVRNLRDRVYTLCHRQHILYCTTGHICVPPQGSH